MSIEYLLVTFPAKRAVLADGDPVGFTNHTLMLPAGGYSISLDGGGCIPQNQQTTLTDTTIVNPTVVAFSAVAADA
jgi:hypothetical protein